MSHTVKLLLKEPVTHNVNRYILEKPEGYEFTPGQATEVAINQKGWEDKKHPFTFTSLNQDKLLEFTIKSYDPRIHPDHEGVTFKLATLVPGDELIIEEPWGTITYEGEGVFIAGGAGITPFIAIFKHLYAEGKIGNNKLIFSNKKEKDIIMEGQLKNFFKPQNLMLTLTGEEKESYAKGRVDEQKIKKYFNPKDKFYVCGPPPMLKDIKEILNNFGVSPQSVVFEK